MKKKFTKYPSKVYATKAYTKDYVISDPILISSDGNFKLVIVGGIGTRDTPYTDFEVRRSNKASNAVVDVELHRGFGDSFEGFPVIRLPNKYKDEYAYVNYGFSSKTRGNDWIRGTLIPILDEAVTFCDAVNAYFESKNREELSEICKDVFLDMGIDYDSYIQQEADSYL